MEALEDPSLEENFKRAIEATGEGVETIIDYMIDKGLVNEADIPKITGVIKKTKNVNGDYYKFYEDNLYVTSMILFAMIEENKIYYCKEGKKYFKDIFIAKQKIREFLNDVNANKKKVKKTEGVFIRLKIPNKRYDTKHSDNPFKMYVNCNYDDIFIKEGN